MSQQSHFWIYVLEVKSGCWRDMCTSMFTAALFTTAVSIYSIMTLPAISRGRYHLDHLNACQQMAFFLAPVLRPEGSPLMSTDAPLMPYDLHLGISFSWLVSKSWLFPSCDIAFLPLTHQCFPKCLTWISPSFQCQSSYNSVVTHSVLWYYHLDHCSIC